MHEVLLPLPKELDEMMILALLDPEPHSRERLRGAVHQEPLGRAAYADGRGTKLPERELFDNLRDACVSAVDVDAGNLSARRPMFAPSMHHLRTSSSDVSTLRQS
jgi:hypothetical protein